MNKKKIYTLSYSNTLDPAPYLYQLDIHFDFTEQGVHVKYNKHFLNREDFSEEELEEEGFSRHDDIEIDSTLGANWAAYFESLIHHADWTGDKPYDNIGQTVSLCTKDDVTIHYLVLNKIEYHVEEVYQAILENAKIESPLSLHLKKIHNGSEGNVELLWHFKDRLFEAITANKRSKKTWEEGQGLLLQFYEIDLAELPVYKKKLPEGKTCINPGDGLWYELPSDPYWQKMISDIY
jgi:hypothetical protein